MPARAANKLAGDLLGAFSTLSNKHATLHGVKWVRAGCERSVGMGSAAGCGWYEGCVEPRNAAWGQVGHSVS